MDTFLKLLFNKAIRVGPVVYIIFFPVVGLLFLLAGFYVLALEPKCLLNRIFFALSLLLLSSCLLALIIQFKSVYSSPQLRELAMRAGSINFMWIIYGLLMFNVVLTRISSSRWYIWVLWAVMPVYVSIRLVLIDQASTYTLENGLLQWVEFNPIFGMINNYVSLYLVSMIVFLGVWHRRSSLRKVKKQSRILIIAQLLTIMCVLIDTYYLFYLGDFFQYKTPGASTFYFIIWYAGMAYALLRLRLIKRDSLAYQGRVLAEIEEGVLLMDTEFRIQWYNEAFSQLLDLHENLVQNDVSEIVRPDDRFKSDLASLDGQRKHSLSTRLDLAYDGLELLRVEARVSKLEDEFGDPTGYLLIVKEAKTLQHLKRQYGITNREAEVIRHIVAGLSNQDIAWQLQITERTVKAHVTSIFNKMVVDNRVQLIVQLRKYRILPDFQADILTVSNI